MRQRMMDGRGLALLLVCGASLAASPYQAPPGVFPSTGPRDFTGAYAGATRLGLAPSRASSTMATERDRADFGPAFTTAIS